MTDWAAQFLREINEGKPHWQQRSPAQLANFLVAEGWGFSAAYRAVYGEPERFDAWQDHARTLRQRGKRYEFIRDLLRLTYFPRKPSLSEVVRACDPKQAEKHRAYMREYMRARRR